VTLQKVRSNRVLLIVDKHPEDSMFHEMAINAASAARAAMGVDIPQVVVMDKPVLMKAEFSGGRAVGRIENFENICEILKEHEGSYDAVALSTLISVPEHYHTDYFDPTKHMEVNPWGGVEAMLTHSISALFDVPSAHSPMMTSSKVMNLDVGVVDPRKASEAISGTFLHSVLKGLHRAPKILPGIHNGRGLVNVQDISCLIQPKGCIGLPTLAAIENNIPIIAVEDRGSVMKNNLASLPFEPGGLYYARDHLEALGIATALKSGVSVDAVRRPMLNTRVNLKE